MHRKVSFENLDSLRFLAFLSVFLYHAFYTRSEAILADPVYRVVKGAFVWGSLGVNFFFVLSGFLITYLLLEEREASGTINVKHFYIRRLLRIWPLYFLTVFTGFIVFPLIKQAIGQASTETADPWLFAVFLSNFNNIFNGPPDASVLHVLWSVSIEEQFYIFWPLLLLFLPQRYYFIAFILLIVGSVMFAMWNARNYDVRHFHTLSVVSELAIGGLSALLVKTRQSFRRVFEGIKKHWIIIFYIIGILILVYFPRFDKIAYVNTSVKVLLSIFFAFVILEQNFARHSFFKLGKVKIFNALGKYSYGLYCLHFIGILMAIYLSKLVGLSASLSGVLIFETVMSLLFTIIMSWCSYHFYEKWFLQHKKNFAVITR